MLSIVAQEVTMSSLDFLNNYINPAREEENQSPVRNRDFIKKVCDECDLDIGRAKISFVNGNRVLSHDLTYDQMMLVGMRESKAVRKSVLSKLKELQQPQQDPALVLAHKVIEQAARIDELEKTKAQINDKRTATLMNKASQDAKKIKRLENQLQDVGEYQSIIAAGLPQRTEIEVNPKAQTWRILKKISEEMGIPPKKVKDERYGEVNTYHVSVIARYKEDYLY